VIGLLQRIDPTIPVVQALILEPTRELAKQSYEVVDKIGSYMKINVHLATGGNSVGRDAAVLRKGAHVVSGTPGRIEDLLRRNMLSFKDLKLVILDEADEMLNQGFQDVIRDILQAIPGDAQVGLFSATLPPWAIEIAEKVMRNPLRIIVKKEDLTLAGIRQYYVDVDREEFKFDILVDLYDFLNVSQCVIFVNTRRKANWLADKLNAQDFTVSCINSDLPPEERSKIMDEFRIGNARILIATDLLARGIDVQGVSVVINFDITTNFENYIHRIGRGGRFGRKGLAINFVTSKEHQLLRELEAFYSTEIPELPSDFK